MDALIKSIVELGEIRKTPQFLYYAPIWGAPAIKLREAIIEYKKKNPKSAEIDFIINSPGGSADDAYKIIRTLRENFTTVNIIVPFWAKSASTLLSLGGSAIIMDEWGEFGALDAQLSKQKDDSPSYESESALIDETSLEILEDRAHRLFIRMFISLYKNDDIPIHKDNIANDVFTYLSKFYEPLLKQINPYKIGYKKRALDIGAQYANRILREYNPQVRKFEREAFIEYLVNECPDHGYVVDYAILKKSLPTLQVQQAKELDAKFAGYSNKLAEISLYLLKSDHSKEDFTGFIDDSLLPKKEEKKTENPTSNGKQKATKTKPVKPQNNGQTKQLESI